MTCGMFGLLRAGAQVRGCDVAEAWTGRGGSEAGIGSGDGGFPIRTERQHHVPAKHSIHSSSEALARMTHRSCPVRAPKRFNSETKGPTYHPSTAKESTLNSPFTTPQRQYPAPFPPPQSPAPNTVRSQWPQPPPIDPHNPKSQPLPLSRKHGPQNPPTLPKPARFQPSSPIAQSVTSNPA